MAEKEYTVDMKTWTVVKFKETKGVAKLATATAYDYAFARLADEAGLPLVLVGDSLGMTMLGYSSTLPVTMEEMLHHTAAVARGCQTNTLVVGDMPFLSYQVNIEEGLRNAGRFLQVGADAVKFEGGECRSELIKACVANGIPVMGHIGLTPQSVNVFGGFKVQGKTEDTARQLLADAKALDKAGVFSMVLECVPPDLAKIITESVSIPTISVGAGPACDVQMLVMHDMLGFTEKTPKFVKRYANLGETVKAAYQAYMKEVADGTFPGPENCYKSMGISIK
jgi:3-methyl-2-oxobutanoate hydroxymethyltransferase